MPPSHQIPSDTLPDRLSFYSHTDLGRRLLGMDWSVSSIGAITTWPNELHSMIGMMLACPRPMCLAWGDDLNFFYNQAYEPILGHRAPGAMGKPIADVWESIWPSIQPLVMASIEGKGQSFTDMKLDLSRRNVPEESWWSFTYSPLYDAIGKVAGFLCVTNETTDKILALRAREKSDELLELALSGGNGIGIWDWDVKNDIVTSDYRFATLYGVVPEMAEVGAALSVFFGRIHPEDRGRLQEEITQAIQNRSAFSSEYRLVDESGKIRWVLAQGRCIYDENGSCVRFPGVSFDVTHQRDALDRLTFISESRKFLLDLIRQQRSLRSAQAIMLSTAESIANRMGIDHVAFYRATGAKHIKIAFSWNFNGIEFPSKAADELNRYIIQDNLRKYEAFEFSNSSVDYNGKLKELSHQAILAGFYIPYVDEGVIVGGLIAFHSEARLWKKEELLLLENICETSWLTIQRAEAMVALGAEVERQSMSLEKTGQELKEQKAENVGAADQIHQLQKMEALGQLTGGIAHDFNNILAVIIGSLSMMELRMKSGSLDLEKYLNSARSSAQRAVTLTHRLLAFSRLQPLTPIVTSPNEAIQNIAELLSSSVGAGIKFEYVLAAGAWPIKVDLNQLENVILNFAVNARNAMPDGGKLTIETVNSYIDEEYGRRHDIPSGQYILISVSDTGVGMSPETIQRAFEPFFTTKPVGKGTGLGLSQAFGFARQSGGQIKIYSELGKGTSMKLYLPRNFGNMDIRTAKPLPRAVTGGNQDEVIFVVEDEERMRQLSVEALRELGYLVISAPTGEAALQKLRAGQVAHVLFTDIVMPGMSGRQLADEALKLLPNLQVIYTTGYTRNAVVHNGIVDPGTNFLQKPFSIEELDSMIRTVLDEKQ